MRPRIIHKKLPDDWRKFDEVCNGIWLWWFKKVLETKIVTSLRWWGAKCGRDELCYDRYVSIIYVVEFYYNDKTLFFFFFAKPIRLCWGNDNIDMWCFIYGQLLELFLIHFFTFSFNDMYKRNKHSLVLNF